MKYYLGIDNGVSGSIAIIKPSGEIFFSSIPTKKEQSYTKSKQNISRIDFQKTIELLKKQIPLGSQVYARIERPMVNPGRFKATVSALRALESILLIVEDIMHYPFEYIDSKEWQRALLPAGIKGDELKKASMDIGNRIFPQFKNHDHEDRDGLLIAEYCRRKQL